MIAEDLRIKIKDPRKIITNGETTYFNSKLEDKEGYFTLYDIGSIILECE